MQRVPGNMRIMLLTDSFLPHGGGARVYYYNLYKNVVAEFPDDVTVLTKKVPGWREFDSRESSASLKIIRRGTPLRNWKYHQWPRVLVPFADALRLTHRQRP